MVVFAAASHAEVNRGECRLPVLRVYQVEQHPRICHDPPRRDPRKLQDLFAHEAEARPAVALAVDVDGQRHGADDRPEPRFAFPQGQFGLAALVDFRGEQAVFLVDRGLAQGSLFQVGLEHGVAGVCPLEIKHADQHEDGDASGRVEHAPGGVQVVQLGWGDEGHKRDRGPLDRYQDGVGAGFGYAPLRLVQRVWYQGLDVAGDRRGGAAEDFLHLGGKVDVVPVEHKGHRVAVRGGDPRYEVPVELGR